MTFSNAFITVWMGKGVLVLEEDRGEPFVIRKMRENGWRFRGNIHKHEILGTEYDFKLTPVQQERINSLKETVIFTDHNRSFSEPGTYPLSEQRLAELSTIFKEL